MGLLQRRRDRKEIAPLEHRFEFTMSRSYYAESMRAAQNLLEIAQRAHDPDRISTVSSMLRFASEKRYEQLIKTINSPNSSLAIPALAEVLREATELSRVIGRPQSVTDELLGRATAVQAQLHAEELKRQNSPEFRARQGEFERTMREAQRQRDRRNERRRAKSQERMEWIQRGYRPP